MKVGWGVNRWLCGWAGGGRAGREGAGDGVVEVESGVRSGSVFCRCASGCCVCARGVVWVVVMAVEVE